MQNLDYNLVECQALVLAPTRELAQQIEKVRGEGAAGVVAVFKLAGRAVQP